uniref:Uncharacterized protein n=1 Tax=Kryptolebias marmoratus TaxID=37003 RepID=A0A3Q3B0C2_KRYMA
IFKAQWYNLSCSRGEKQTQKKELDRARNKTRVNIGAAFQRWKQLRVRKGFRTDAEVATFLLDRTECSQLQGLCGEEAFTPNYPSGPKVDLLHISDFSSVVFYSRIHVSFK